MGAPAVFLPSCSGPLSLNRTQNCPAARNGRCRNGHSPFPARWDTRIVHNVPCRARYTSQRLRRPSEQLPAAGVRRKLSAGRVLASHKNIKSNIVATLRFVEISLLPAGHASSWFGVESM